MHIVLPTPGGFGLYLIPNIIGWFAIALLIAIAIIQIAKVEKFYWSKFHVGYLLGILLLIIPIFYGGEFVDKSYMRLFGLVAGYLFLLSLFQMRFSERQRLNVLLLFLLGIGIECFLGLIQFFLLSLFDIQVLGYTPIYGRPYGSFTQPNVMASFLAAGIGLASFLLIHIAQFKFKRLVQLLCTFVLFTSPILLVVLQSKTGYLAGILVLALLIPSLLRDRPKLKMVLIAIFVGLIVGLFSFKYLKTVPVKSNIYSDSVRTTIIQVSSKMFFEKPIMGYGYGEFEKQYREFHLDLLRQGVIDKFPLDDLGHPHNEILLWGVEGGIISLLGLLIIMITALRLCKDVPLLEKLQYSALLLPVLLHSLLEYPFYHSAIHLFYCLTLLWFIETKNKQAQLQQTQINTTYKVILNLVSGILTMFSIAYFLISIHTSFKLEAFKRSKNEDNSQIRSIIHPLAWRDYYELVIYQQGLVNGYKQQNPEALKRYIYWGVEFVKYRPRYAVYNNMLAAIDTLQKNDIKLDSALVKKIQEDASRLYPRN